ncbi:unnamed protein product [Echinostoma caproni]|uniref:Uncharacterized protein n=1 Tax=Echinostoma caproni TaxID=27848 RepID=A0A183ATF8_9TREM|nr:unnamed protein product [Echinostoma caproni]
MQWQTEIKQERERWFLAHKEELDQLETYWEDKAERKLLRRKIDEQNAELTRLQQELDYMTDQTRERNVSSKEIIKQLEQKLEKSNRENVVLRDEQQRVLTTMKTELQSCEDRLRQANAEKNQLHDTVIQYASHVSKPISQVCV